MKTPDEIKNGLERCKADRSICDECEFSDGNVKKWRSLMGDALSYIEQLEERDSLNTLRDAIYEDAVAHGLWERTDYTVQLVLQSIRRDDRTTAYRDKIMRELAMRVIRLEVDELEGSVEYEEDYVDELADVIIASLSVAGKLGIDIDAAVRRKMEINKARPWKHGKETECNT